MRSLICDLDSTFTKPSNQSRIDEIKELISYCEEGDIQLEELYCELDELTMGD